jgi:putative nucleotidyltransferase with HDIG domain
MNADYIINKINALPTLPDIVIQLNSLLKNSSSSLDEVASLVEKDSALSSKVLRLANSSYYGLSSKVGSVSRAIIVLGFNTLCNAVTTVAVSDMFTNRKGEVDLAGLWLHTLGCAVASKVVIQKKNYMEADKAFICGIMHDIGKVAIANSLPEEQKKVLSLLNKPGKTLLEAEREVLEIDHAEIGHALAQKWHFPSYIVDTIRYHHSPAAAKMVPDLAAAVHLGNVIAKALALGKSTEPRVTFIDPSAWGQLGITETEVKPIVAAVQDEFDLAMEFWMIDR